MFNWLALLGGSISQLIFIGTIFAPSGNNPPSVMNCQAIPINSNPGQTDYKTKVNHYISGSLFCYPVKISIPASDFEFPGKKMFLSCILKGSNMRQQSFL